MIFCCVNEKFYRLYILGINKYKLEHHSDTFSFLFLFYPQYGKSLHRKSSLKYRKVSF